MQIEREETRQSGFTYMAEESPSSDLHAALLSAKRHYRALLADSAVRHLIKGAVNFYLARGR